MRAFRISLTAFIGLLLAVWIVPATLDWNRFRGAIAAFAAAELGRPVSIGGGVTLRLLPRAILTADDVTFPDQGDGVSARLHALRLEVAVWPLLRGRLVVSDLVLGEPLLKLPWPLPPNLGMPVRPYVRHPFTARLERGGVQLGAVALTGIEASLHSDAAGGDLTVLGAAELAGAAWRFTTSLGPPDSDGAAGLGIAVDGQGAYAGTRGRFSGTLTTGTLSGRIDGEGPDLSRIVAAPPGPWHASGPIEAGAGRLELPALSLALPHAGPVRGRMLLRITRPAALDLALDAAEADLSAWLPAVTVMPTPDLPMRLALKAGRARLLGGDVTGLDVRLALDGDGALVQHCTAMLPGGASLSLSGKAGRDAGGVWVAGPASLDAPDLHAVLAWLHPLAPGLLGPPPGRALRSARVTATLHASAAGVSLSGLAGSLDGARVSGGFGIGFGATPGFGMGLTMERLALDDYLPEVAWWSGFDGDLFIRSASATWHGQDLGALDAFLHSAGGERAVNRLTLEGTAGKLALSGKVGADGSLAELHVSAMARDLSRLGAAAARWGLPGPLLQPGLWQGDASFEMTGEGPPRAWSLQVRADASDLQLETQAMVDAPAARATVTLTMRHPGAPRLLAALGVSDADRWLDNGSFALLAHLTVDGGRVLVTDADLTAATLRLTAQADADLSQPVPSLNGSVVADTLPLPWREAMPVGWLHGWSGQFRVAAGQVLADLRPAAQGLRTLVTVQNGAILADALSARVGDAGSVSGQLAADLDQAPRQVAAQLRFSGIRLDAAATGLPVDIGAADIDGSADIGAAGADAAEWSRSCTGQFTASLRDARVMGLDLARVARLAGVRQKSPRLLAAALTSGSSDGLAGSLAGQIEHGRLTLAPSALTAPAGTLAVSGTLTLDGSGSDLAIQVSPAVETPPTLKLHLSGPWVSARVQADVGVAAPVPGRALPVRRRGARRPARPH